MQQSVCPVCGAVVSAGDCFCMDCGAALAASQPKDSAGSCPNCGCPVEEDSLFCVNCGIQLSQAAMAFQPPYGGTRFMPTRTPQDHRDAMPKPAASTPHADKPHVIPMDGGMTLGMEDDLTVRQRLLMITKEEASQGCRKILEIDGTKLEINIPAGIGEGTKLDVAGWGYRDEETGAQGPLRLSVIVM